jgi:hypothetical protein
MSVEMAVLIGGGRERKVDVMSSMELRKEHKSADSAAVGGRDGGYWMVERSICCDDFVTISHNRNSHRWGPAICLLSH